MHKRKHPKSIREADWEQSVHTASTSHVQCSAEVLDSPPPDPCLCIQAYEADVIRGPLAASARSLECQDPSLTITESNVPRSGLIRWGPLEHSDGTESVGIEKSNQPPLWVDRYDLRLLLDRLPTFESYGTQARPLSPSGWSDLPSDSEDTFFFSPDELQEYRREKRRRLIDRDREERLRGLAAMDREVEDPDPWGGSDEEPDETQRELIRRTATHIISSPNPAQLEMRILANYGTDKRFAFLRGRWPRVWRTEKEKAKRRQAEEAERVQVSKTHTPLGGLASYGDSDSDGEESVEEPTEAPGNVMDMPCVEDGHDVVKEARRARAREWSARRRAEQSSPVEEI